MTVNPEYLRRNLLHCSAVGAWAGADSALKRLQSHKRPPKWLIEQLQGIKERAGKVKFEMVLHRDEVAVSISGTEPC